MSFIWEWQGRNCNSGHANYGQSEETKERSMFTVFWEETRKRVFWTGVLFVGSKTVRLWKFLIGSKQRAVAVAGVSREDSFLPPAGYANCQEWVLCEGSLLLASWYHFKCVSFPDSMQNTNWCAMIIFSFKIKDPCTLRRIFSQSPLPIYKLTNLGHII